MCRLLRACLSLALLAAALSTAASETREIESPAAAGSLAPSIATLADGRLVLTWLEPSGKGHALRFSVLGDDGFGSARTIARGAGWFANWADTPGLFVLPGGDWVAHWLVKSGPSTYAYDVKLARSSDGGSNWSAPLSPHRDGTPTEHGFVSYFAASDHAVGVVWLDGRRLHQAREGEGAMTLRTAVVGPGGGLADQALLDERVCDCCRTAAVMTREGPVVVYRDRSEAEIRDHAVVRRTAGGWSAPKRLHADDWRIAACPVNGPAMVADGDRVAVAWFTMGGGEPRVELAVSGDSGASFKHVDTLDAGTALGRVDLTLYGDGLVLSWLDRPDSGGVLELAAYDWGGQRRWRRQAAELDAGRASGFPRIAALGDCALALAWTGTDGAGGSRVRVAGIDPDGVCAAATD